jgi:hypothetical protein
MTGRGISVLVPTRGRARLVELLLDSPERCDRDGALDVEILVVDDSDHPAALQLRAQPGVGAVDLVPGHPPRRHPGDQRTDDHAGSQRGLGQEPDVIRHPGLDEALLSPVHAVGR